MIWRLQVCYSIDASVPPSTRAAGVQNASLYLSHFPQHERDISSSHAVRNGHLVILNYSRTRRCIWAKCEGYIVVIQMQGGVLTPGLKRGQMCPSHVRILLSRVTTSRTPTRSSLPRTRCMLLLERYWVVAQLLLNVLESRDLSGIVSNAR